MIVPEIEGTEHRTPHSLNHKLQCRSMCF